MRILLFVVYYLPSTNSAAKLMNDLGKEFLRKGHEVSVVAPDPGITADFETSLEEGIEVCRVGTGEIRNVSKSIRAWRELTLSHVLWKKGKPFFTAREFDLIVYYSPTIFFGPLVKRLRRLYHSHTYLVLRDIFPQWALDAGVLREGLFYRVLRHYERIHHEAADVIGVQSPANRQYFIQKKLDMKYTVEVLYNWMSVSADSVPAANYRQKLGLEDKIIFFYGGNIGVAQDMDNLLRASRRLLNMADVIFLVVGEGSEVPRLKREADRMGLRNFLIHPAVGQEEYMKIVSDIDVGLISLNRDLKTHNYPGKMLSYMYYSKPILASINQGNDLREILMNHEAGLVSINGEDDLFHCHALDLIMKPELRKRLGTNGRKLLESTFSTSSACNRILRHFS